MESTNMDSNFLLRRSEAAIIESFITLLAATFSFSAPLMLPSGMHEHKLRHQHLKPTRTTAGPSTATKLHPDLNECGWKSSGGLRSESDKVKI